MECSSCKLEFNNKGGLIKHQNICKLLINDINDIKKKYLNGYSIRKISKEYKISKIIIYKILKGMIRSASESNKISHKMFPRKHSDESKKKMRYARLRWMKENPEKTAWRLYNLSYPEKLFLDKIKDIKLDDKYLIIREKSFFPYFIDFAFENEKLAIEIDGSQHENEERRKNDVCKDKLLIENGWMVLRFTANKIKYEIDECIEIIKKFLDDRVNGININTGVFLYKEQKKIIKEKNITKFGISKYQKNGQMVQRKVKRPELNILLEDISELGYCGTGRKYGVTDNSIRKWIKMYKKYGEDF